MLGLADQHFKDGEVANSTDGSSKAFRSEVALGRLRMDGAVSIDGPYGKAGNLTTKPLIFQGSMLYLNCDASGGGAITVTVYSAGSRERLLGPSSPIVHSSVRMEVLWEPHVGNHAVQSLKQLAGIPVVLIISIEEAELYSFQFAG